MPSTRTAPPTARSTPADRQLAALLPPLAAPFVRLPDQPYGPGPHQWVYQRIPFVTASYGSTWVSNDVVVTSLISTWTTQHAAAECKKAALAHAHGYRYSRYTAAGAPPGTIAEIGTSATQYNDQAGASRGEHCYTVSVFGPASASTHQVLRDVLRRLHL